MQMITHIGGCSASLLAALFWQIFQRASFSAHVCATLTILFDGLLFISRHLEFN